MTILNYKTEDRPYKDFTNEELIKAYLGEGEIEMYNTTYVLRLHNKPKDKDWKIENELETRGIFIIAVWTNKVGQKVPFLYRYEKGHLYYKTGWVSITPHPKKDTLEEKKAYVLVELGEMGFDPSAAEVYWDIYNAQ